MVDEWLHLEELRGDPWILPIWGSVNEAVKKGILFFDNASLF
ncbi:MAG: hypothetical protein ACW980_25425 [Promethearchaeota archaeon]|jgi:hypothetical protein